MTHRIEIAFTGDGPSDELARAKILASAGVTSCIDQLTAELDAAGFKHEVRVTVTRSVPTRANRRGTKLAEAAE